MNAKIISLQLHTSNMSIREELNAYREKLVVSPADMRLVTNVLKREIQRQLPKQKSPIIYISTQDFTRNICDLMEVNYYVYAISKVDGVKHAQAESCIDGYSPSTFQITYSMITVFLDI